MHALLKPWPDCSRPSRAPTTAAAATFDRLSATRLSLRLSPLFKSCALWTLKSYALWTPQKLCFMCFMDSSEVVLYGLFGSCALWTLQKLCFMDSSEVVLYGPLRSCALWILQKLCFVDSSKVVLFPLYGPFKSCAFSALWTLQKLCFFHFMDPSKVVLYGHRLVGNGERHTFVFCCLLSQEV